MLRVIGAVRLIYTAVFLSVLSVSAREPFLLLNIHDGLAESRVRCLAELPDGRMAVATTATVDIYDGTTFRSFPVSPQEAYTLADYHGYRRMTADGDGRLWLHNKGTLHVILPDIGVADADSVFVAIGWNDGRMTAFFVDNGYGIRAGSSRYWAATADGGLYCGEGGKFSRVADLKVLGCGVPEKILSVSSRIFLCFSTGRVCELSRNGNECRMVFDGVAVADSLSPQLRHGISARIINGSLWVTLNHRDEHHAFLARLDLSRHEWLPLVGLRMRTSHMEVAGDSLVYVVGNRGLYMITPGGHKLDKIRELPVDNGNETASVSDDLSSIVFDRYGGIWIGATESGLLYSNSLRSSLIKADTVMYPHRANARFCSQKAREYAERIAPGLTNCSAETADGTVYIGTRNGLFVVDGSGRVVACLDRNDGFSSPNIQSLLVVGDDVWVASATGIGCVTQSRPGCFELRHYGRLDGLRLGGRELLVGKMCLESPSGVVRAGFGGGSFVFFPDSLKAFPRYVFRHDSCSTNRLPHTSSVLWVIGGLLVAAGLFAVIRCRRMKRSVENVSGHIAVDAVAATLPTEAVRSFTVATEGKVQEMMLDIDSGRDGSSADELFLYRLRETVEAHLSDGSFSVQGLASELAMDRTGLFRRVQQLTGQSPSAYIRTIRMNVAARLLAESSLPVADIASRTGFSSSKYFSRIFKDTYGVLPKDYRASRMQADGSV